MFTSVLASTAILASTAMASSVGKAVVVNKCNYDVTLCNVPASGGGYEEINETLKAGKTYSQEYLALSNDNGWSIKLSQSDALTDILQYEYTYQNDDRIWYDLSNVDGNPWDGNWEISAEGSTCSPKQTAYRYSTDDAHGMQGSCPSETVITVTLCSGNSGDDTSSSASSSEPAPETSSAPAYTSSAAALPTSYAAKEIESAAPKASSSAVEVAPVQETSSAAKVTPTTFATMTSKAPATTEAAHTEAAHHGHAHGHHGKVVTVVDTAYVTDFVTATYWEHHNHGRNAAPTPAAKRHAHHPHAHN